MKNKISSIMDNRKSMAGLVIMSLILTLIVGTGLVFALTPAQAERGESNSLRYANSDITTIRIGVGNICDYVFGHNILKRILEDEFQIKVEFVELMQGTTDFESYVERVGLAFKTNEVDLVIDVPSHAATGWIANGWLLDITDYLSNISNIHRGVVDISKSMGDGRMYFISPIINDVRLVFTNQFILSELDVDPMPPYLGWGDFLNRLEEIQFLVEQNELAIYPLALAIGHYDDHLFIAHEFLMQSAGLSSHLFEYSGFTEQARELFEIFAQVVAKFGKTEMELNSPYPRNLIFSQGNFAHMVGDVSDLEILFNTDWRDTFNSTAPAKILAEFPISVSIINFDGSKKQNLRDSAIFVSANSNNRELTIDILNFLTGERFANELISRRDEFSFFTAVRLTFPSYFNDDTIRRLNENYSGSFDVSLIYDVEFGNVIKGMYILDWELVNLLNETFAQIRIGLLGEPHRSADIVANAIKHIEAMRFSP